MPAFMPDFMPDFIYVFILFITPLCSPLFCLVHCLCRRLCGLFILITYFLVPNTTGGPNKQKGLTDIFIYYMKNSGEGGCLFRVFTLMS